jgi:cytochrome P450
VKHNHFLIGVTMTLATTTLEKTDITSPEFRANPFPIFKRWRDHQPVVPVKVLGSRAWLITRYDDVEAVLKDERLVKNKLNARDPNKKYRDMPLPGFVKPLQTNILDQDAPDHTRLRSLVHQAFLPRLMAQMQTRVHDLSHELIDRAQAKGEMDLVRDFAVEIPLVVICDMLGVPEKDRNKFHVWSKAMTNVGKPIDAILAMPSIYGMVQYLRRLFRHYRENPGDNLATMLVKAESENSSLSEDELIGMAGILLSAGHETTSGLIGNGVLALLNNPDQLERLKTEPALMKSAVEELVRFAPPVLMGTSRYAREDMTIAGTQISQGDAVYAMIGSANHDERKFDQPETLMLDRSNNKHLGFGQGIHYCIGAPLARLEASTAFEVLFERLPNLRLAVKPEELRWASSLVPRGLQSMPVKF